MIEILWILASLIFASVIGIIAARYGPEYGIGAIAGLVVVSNILGSAKIVQFSFLGHVPAGIVAYALVFFLSNVLNEYYGPKTARKAVYIGFITQAIAAFLIYLALIWPTAELPNPEMNADMQARAAAASVALNLVPRVFLAALLAFTISNLFNVFVFAKIRSMTKTKFLWLRNEVSILSSLFVSDVIFITTTYLGVIPMIERMIINHYIVQVLVAVLSVFFIYSVAALAGRMGIKPVGIGKQAKR